MHSTKIKFISFFVILFVFIGNSIFAQNGNYTTVDSLSAITVTGTSTLHGWTVAVNEVKDVPISLNIDLKEGASINSFSFGIVVKSMDGGRGASMNTKITNALKASEHPIITYQQNQPAILKNVKKDGSFQLESNGILNMAGMEKEISIEVNGQKNADGTLIFKGAKPLKFSAFNIEPPSAMFGQIVCGDDIAVNFEFKYLSE